MAEIAVAVASEVAKCLVAPVGRHCGYVIFCDRRVCELNAEIKKLVGTKHDVQRSIDEAQNNMKPIKATVETWVKEVQTVANKARDVLDYDGRAQKTCFYGWLPNPKARYRLGNEASKMIEEIKGLIMQGQFERVYNENPPPGLVGGASDVNLSAGDGGNTMLKSQASTFQDVMKALYDEKHKVIGVYGPGGVGKTTLLEMVEEKLKKEKEEKLEKLKKEKEEKLKKEEGPLVEEKLKKEEGPLVEEKLNKEGKLNKDKEGKLNKEWGPFDMIVKSKVSETPDLTKIQFDIAYALGLKDLKDEPSEAGRRDLLFKRLQKNPSEKVLIILDDLWAKLDLKAVGIPLGNESMKCKLLIASRDKRVLEQRMHADQTFPLKSLEEEEALKLFEKIVGDRLRDDEELKEKAAQVVTKLAGLPLLINSVASTLKCSDVSTWEDMLIKIDDPNNERIVKWSYDHLESEEAKCLFLLCGLIGGTIEVELLLRLGMGLGLFGGFDNKMQSLRNRLNTMLNSLHSFCLLQDGGDGKETVTIHDLYSEVVVSNVFSDQNSLMIDNNCGSWPKEKLEKCWACLVNGGSNRLVELMPRRFTHVKILMLSEQYDMGDCRRMDFTYLGELRVLYLGSMHITSLPSSMEILGNLRSLSISCHVEDVANLGKLKALQILSFVGSEISKLPKELGKLMNLRSLNLSNCYSLEIIEPGALKGLINLEELHMKESFNQWRGKHELAELKSLTKLASLEIYISDPKILSKDGDLPFEKLEKFWINVGDAEAREYEGLTTMKLNLEGCDGILSREWVKKNLQKTQCLYLSNWSEFARSPRELCTQGFREVKYLDIEDSPSIKYVADSSKDLSLIVFGKLESFFLENLINLEKICHGPVAPECFNKLKVVCVKRCDRLKYLWCLSDMQRLVQLEEIEVWKCDSMQSIVTHDAGEDIVSTDNKVELPNLRRLVLNELPNMTSFCTKAEITSEDIPIQVSLPRLESLVMVGLLNLEKILYSEPSLKYNNLKSLEIKESKSMSIISKDCILKLSNLESMKIVGSPSAEVVFDLEELKVTGDAEILSSLTKLNLSKLPNLRCIWKQDGQLQGISIFRNLKGLFINNTGLSFLFSVSMAKCLREIRGIEVENCPNMKAVIVDEEGRDDGRDDTIEFPLLERLSISHCPTEKFFSYPHGKKESITTTSYSQDNYLDSFFDQTVSLPSLEKLILHSVGSFKSTGHSELPKSSSDKLANLALKQDLQLQEISIFRNLKLLFINNIGLSFLFLVSMAKYLREIRCIQVEDCPNMKAVIVDEEGRDDGRDDIIEFPLLERLSISRCPTEKFFSYPHGKKESITTTSDSQDNYLDSFFDQKISLPRLEMLNLDSVGSFKRIWHGELPKSSFDKLADLTLEKCSNLLDVFPSIIIDRLHNLETIKVSKCPSLESLFDFGSLDSYAEQTIVLLPQLENVEVRRCHSLESLFDCRSLDSNMEKKIVLLPKLEVMIVSGARRLRHMVMSDSQMVLGFPSLNGVGVHNCSELRYLFLNYTATTLKKLEILVIIKCEQMKEVVPKEEGGRSKAKVMSFPSLTVLVILRCPNFGAFIQSPTSAERQLGKMIKENDELPQPLFNDMVTFPNLIKLYIEGVQCKELWNNQIPDDSFCKLESLKLKDCDNLQCIAQSDMWKRLQHCLESLNVNSCRSIEIIYKSDGMVAKSGNLRMLVLRDLDNLRHIWQYDSLPNIPFPSLRYVKAVRCSHLEMLFATFTAKFLGQIEKLVVGSCEDMKLIAGHEECEEVIGKTIIFSELTTLRLDNLPKFRSFLPEKYYDEKYFVEFPSLVLSSITESDQGSQGEEDSEDGSEWEDYVEWAESESEGES